MQRVYWLMGFALVGFTWIRLSSGAPCPDTTAKSIPCPVEVLLCIEEGDAGVPCPERFEDTVTTNRFTCESNPGSGKECYALTNPDGTPLRTLCRQRYKCKVDAGPPVDCVIDIASPVGQPTFFQKQGNRNCPN